MTLNMICNPKTLLLGAAAALFFGLADAQRDTRCDNGPWTDVFQIGGSSGSEFCHTRYEVGAPVTGVEVWASSGQVEAVQFYFADGQDSGRVGKERDTNEHGRLDWDYSQGQVIEQVELWGNGKGEALGRVKIRLSDGKELNIGKDTNGQNVFKHEVHSGVLLGAVGALDGGVVRLGFLFLKAEIDTVRVDDVQFEDSLEALQEKYKSGIMTRIVDEGKYENNNADSNLTTTFGKSVERDTTQTWTSEMSHTFGITHDFELSGQVGGFGPSTKWGLKYEMQKKETSSKSVSEKVSLSYGVSVMLKPGQKTWCRATAVNGVYDGKYHGTVKFGLKDGTEYSFKTEGTSNQVAWSEATASCQDKEFPPVGDEDEVQEEAKRALKFIA